VRLDNLQVGCFANIREGFCERGTVKHLGTPGQPRSEI
jgi:hypothetical protein